MKNPPPSVWRGELHSRYHPWFYLNYSGYRCLPFCPTYRAKTLPDHVPGILRTAFQLPRLSGGESVPVLFRSLRMASLYRFWRTCQRSKSMTWPCFQTCGAFVLHSGTAVYYRIADGLSVYLSWRTVQIYALRFL